MLVFTRPVFAQHLTIGHTPVSIIAPKADHRGDILVLPGWNYGRMLWCEQTRLCDSASAQGYRLILPEMGKSVYASRYYPQTRADYRQRLTLTWVTDTLLPELQAKGYLRPGGANYLLGLSTGARGVVLVAQRTGTLFRAGVALSGDYDPSLDTTDALMRNTYGPYSRFSSRWQGEDSPLANVAKLRVPLLLVHGQQDKVVPWRHSQLLADALRKVQPSLSVKLLLLPNGAHDWDFWGKQTATALDWFAHH